MKNIFLVFLWFCTLSKLYGEETENDDCLCRFHIDILKENHPIILDPNTHTLVYPNIQPTEISLEIGKKLEFHCPNSNISFDDGNKIPFMATGICLGGEYFAISNKSANVYSMECDADFVPNIKKTSVFCPPRGTYLHIGYNLQNRTFLTTYKLCYDPILRTTFSSYQKISKNIGYWRQKLHNPNYYEKQMFNLDAPLDQLYNISYQDQQLRSLLRLPNDHKKYITTYHYLKKCFLVPKDSFMYKYEQITANLYVNILPMWSTLLKNNWRKIEKDIETYPKKEKVDIEVYSGLYARLRLRNEKTLIYHEIFLHISGSLAAVPVPFALWKVIYVPERKQGIALVGLNNPFFRRDLNNSYLCPDISSRLGTSWYSIPALADNYKNGFVYACHPEALRGRLRIIPKLEIESVLDMW